MAKPTQIQLLDVRFERSGESVFVLTLAGDWTRAAMRTNHQWHGLFQRIPSAIGAVGSLGFDCCDLDRWDMRLVAALAGMLKSCNELGCEIDLSGLPDGIRGLFDLASAVPEAEGRGVGSRRNGWLDDLGHRTLFIVQGFWNFNSFLGELLLELLATLRGKTSMRARDFWLAIQNAGPMAVPITTLLAFLTGLIIAYIGVLQLQKLAADIFVADLVGLVMTRELAALMTGVIMAGRTGAAYAAQIGSMRVNDEIDALKSFGISPVRFLVVPKVLALVMMMPLLVALANLVSLFAGLLVAVGISDVTISQYHFQIVNAVGMNDVLVGLFKSLVFGFIIALAGCYRGLRCGRDAAAVGQATTSAVVTAITWIVIFDAIFAVLLNILGI